ncbi:MAG TPA: DUF6443 domain-containing protein, partial [Chitinophaga sp.]|nr:DUF6443 domain-containing protein [Chitinophaga sp.]
MNASAYYRVITTSNGVSVNSNSVFVNVYPALSAGTISPSSGSVASGTSPGTITGTVATGGNGTYTYQWQSSPDGTTWTNVGGATSQNCTPGAITATTRYRRAATSNGVTAYSNVAIFTVYLPVTMANITPDIYEVYFYGAHTFASAPASGGTGVYTYQWQSSANGSTWSDIAGADTLTYTPAGLSATTYYRLKGTSAGITGYSNTITAIIPLNGGIININVPSVASGGAVTLASAQAASGSSCGTYTYQWQSSSDEYTWTNISGTTVSSITKTTWFRRLATCNSKTVSSNIVRVRIKDPAAQLVPNGVTVAPAGTQPVIAMPAYTGIDPDNLNYVRTRNFTKPGITDIATADAQTGVFDVKQVTVYIDGLGRPIQTVAKQSTPDLADLITTNFYDQYGREQQQYLPYTDNGSTGNFRTDAPTKQPVFYNTMYSNQEGYYYKKTIYETSPLNKVLKTTAPGRSWTGQAVGTTSQDRINTRSDSVIIWKINLDTGRIPVQGGYYMPGTLYVGETTDEHDNKVVEFKDLEGRLVLRKTQLSDQLNTGNTGWLSTYYVYDDLDRLRFVLPPKAVDLIKSNWVINSAVASELCYLYRYDGQGRMIVKKLPAADSVEMVYDKRDRLIASRDGNLKFRQFWNVKYYDTQNRERMSGLLYFGYNREQMQTSVDASAFDPTNSFPFLPESGVQDLVKTFYDDYSYSGSIAYNTGDITKPQASGNLYAEALPATPGKATRGMVTGKKARVDYGDQFLMSSVYYDDKGRTIQTAEDNMRGGRETTTNLYAFNGKLLSSYLRHTNPQSATTPQTTLLSMYHYDAGGRIDSVKKRLNDNIALQQTIAVNEYDELGNLKVKRLGPTGASTQLESLNYDYNIRGWMTGLNKSFVNTTSSANWFGMELNYDYGFGIQELNGNITGTKWKSRSDGIARSYGFDYDNTNRFITANFTQQNAGSSAWSKDKADFS